MRIAVFGAGALGSLYGGLLSEDHDVTLVGRQEHVDAVNRSGLRISGLREGVYRLKARTSSEGLGIQDLVLVTVKAYDTRTAAREVEAMVGEGTAVVSLQNGLGNYEVLGKAFGLRVIMGVPFMGVTFSHPGHVCLAGLGETVLGSPSGQHGLAIRVSETLSAVGLSTRVSANIGPEIWIKAIVNASINPITALVRRENGCICQQRELRELSRAVCQECTKAAEANGIALGRVDPFEKVVEVVRMTARNRSSMLQDVERGRRTEIDAINGALAEAGESRGLSMPVNRALWSLVRSLHLQSNL
jgi:2-dehydropantoate 2-reductase